MKIASGSMTPEQVWHEAQEIVSLFKRLHVTTLTVFYGFGCERAMDELYQEIEVKTDELLSFLSQSISEGIYQLGASDFSIESQDLGVQFLLCHESDIHLETENEQVAEQMRVRWAINQPPGYEQCQGQWLSLEKPVPLRVTRAPEAVTERPAT